MLLGLVLQALAGIKKIFQMITTLSKKAYICKTKNETIEAMKSYSPFYANYFYYYFSISGRTRIAI